jgi:hypothetical protein
VVCADDGVTVCSREGGAAEGRRDARARASRRATASRRTTFERRGLGRSADVEEAIGQDDLSRSERRLSDD